ncbi:MAG TPA: Uma2 family endonuclease [Thermoanaerobaculia bacterium]
MAAEPIRRRFTTAEYHAMAESGILAPDDRVELIEGEIWQMSPIGSRHASTVTRSARFFTLRLDGRAVVSTQNPLLLGDLSEPEPDVAILHFREDDYAENHPTQGDVFLLLEVADSSLDYDRRIKMKLYSRYGIPEAWLADLDQSVLEVHRDPSPQGYQEVLRLHRGDRISPLAFPELAIEVAAILG